MAHSDNRLDDAYSSLTDKQLETLQIVADGRTHKELARIAGISVSAATQRIETLRAKFGGVTKAELARIHRQHRKDGDCKEFTGKIFQLPLEAPHPPNSGWNRVQEQGLLADASPVFSADAPWENHEPEVVPEVLNGRHSTAFRLAATAGLATAILVFAIVLLAVANMISDMF